MTDGFIDRLLQTAIPEFSEAGLGPNATPRDTALYRLANKRRRALAEPFRTDMGHHLSRIVARAQHQRFRRTTIAREVLQLADSNKRDAPGRNAKFSAPMSVDDFPLAGRPFDMEIDGAIKNFGSGNTLQGKGDMHNEMAEAEGFILLQ